MFVYINRKSAQHSTEYEKKSLSLSLSLALFVGSFLEFEEPTPRVHRVLRGRMMQGMGAMGHAMPHEAPGAIFHRRLEGSPKKS